MAQTKIVIVYGITDNRVHALITPDDDSQLSVHLNNLQSGQASFSALHSDLMIKGHHQLLANHTKKNVIHKGRIFHPEADA